MARDKKKSTVLRANLSSQLKLHFETAVSLGIGQLDECYDSVYKSFSERLALYTSDCIVSLSKSLNLPISYTATALGYFQLYKSIPESSWDKHATSVYKKFNGQIGNVLGSNILAATCILLAWKYREDESSNPKCIKKLFELSSGIYRLIVSSDNKDSANISASRWILDTGGSV